jgi:hypothetical protein
MQLSFLAQSFYVLLFSIVVPSALVIAVAMIVRLRQELFAAVRAGSQPLHQRIHGCLRYDASNGVLTQCFFDCHWRSVPDAFRQSHDLAADALQFV